MKLASLIEASRVVLDIDATTLDGAIAQLLERAHAFHPAEERGVLLDAVRKREAQSTTALARGIAIPHARVPSLRDFFVLVGRPAQPLEDKCLDGSPVEVIFLLLASDQKNTVMLKTMAAIGKLGQEGAVRQSLLDAPTSDAFLHALEQSNVLVQKGLFARDLMAPAPVIANENMLLRELLDQFSEHGVYQAPVCTPDGAIIGGVSTAEIIDAGFPEYMSRMTNIGFLSDFEPFEQFFKRETTTRVADVYDKKPLAVNQDDPMIQVVFRMRQERCGFAFVEHDGKFVGIIDRNDIISRILRA